MDTWTEDGFIGERLCVGMASFSESEEAARRALWDRIRGCLTVRPCVHVSMWGGGGGSERTEPEGSSWAYQGLIVIETSRIHAAGLSS